MPNTPYVLSYGGRSGRNGKSRLQIVCKADGNRYYLQNKKKENMYRSWATSQSTITGDTDGKACIRDSDTSWTRKWVFFKSHPDYTHDYYLYFAPEANDGDANEYINIDDITLYTISNLDPNTFTAISSIQGDRNARSTDVTLYIHMPDRAAPSGGEVLYQNVRQAVDLDNRTDITIYNLEVWGSIAGDVTQKGKHRITVDRCTVYYGGGAMQGPNGRLGDKSSRYTGAVAFLADKDHAYDKVVVKNCTIERSLGLGIRVRRCHSGRASNNRIKNFVCGNAPWPAAFYGTLVNNFIVEENVCDTAGYDGVETKNKWVINGIWFDNNSNHDIVRYNWVKNITGAYYNCESSDNGKWYYNIGTGGANFGFKLGGGKEAHNNEIYNNTLVGVRNHFDETGRIHTGGAIVLYYQDEGATTVKNNVVHSTSGYYIYVGPKFKGNGVTIDYNNYYGLSGPRWLWKDVKCSTLFQWQKAGANRNDGHGPGESNPLFTNIDEKRFFLSPDSPCVDAGTYVGLDRDYTGTNVPSGEGIDIGAYEYDTTSKGN